MVIGYLLSVQALYYLDSGIVSAYGVEFFCLCRKLVPFAVIQIADFIYVIEGSVCDVSERSDNGHCQKSDDDNE